MGYINNVAYQKLVNIIIMIFITLQNKFWGFNQYVIEKN